jgi:hypothetical protein
VVNLDLARAPGLPPADVGALASEIASAAPWLALGGAEGQVAMHQEGLDFL